MSSLRDWIELAVADTGIGMTAPFVEPLASPLMRPGRMMTKIFHRPRRKR
jgi:hypothetical protein